MGRLARDGMSQVVARHGIDWQVGGDFSGVKINVKAAGGKSQAGDVSLVEVLQSAMLLNGVDVMCDQMFMSCMHREDDIQQTVDAFDRSIDMMKNSGLV
jgi:glutamate-1-semialdehyde aminotransferase